MLKRKLRTKSRNLILESLEDRRVFAASPMAAHSFISPYYTSHVPAHVAAHVTPLTPHLQMTATHLTPTPGNQKPVYAHPVPPSSHARTSNPIYTDQVYMSQGYFRSTPNTISPFRGPDNGSFQSYHNGAVNNNGVNEKVTQGNDENAIPNRVSSSAAISSGTFHGAAGTPVVAARDGTVVPAGEARGFEKPGAATLTPQQKNLEIAQVKSDAGLLKEYKNQPGNEQAAKLVEQRMRHSLEMLKNDKKMLQNENSDSGNNTSKNNLAQQAENAKRHALELLSTMNLRGKTTISITYRRTDSVHRVDGSQIYVRNFSMAKYSIAQVHRYISMLGNNGNLIVGISAR